MKPGGDSSSVCSSLPRDLDGAIKPLDKVECEGRFDATRLERRTVRYWLGSTLMPERAAAFEASGENQ